MASFSTILSDIGHGLKLFFTGAVTVAKAAEPVVDILFPGVSVLYNTTVNAVAAAESAAIAAGSQNGTGVQKLAMVVASIENDFAAYAKANNITYSAHIQQYDLQGGTAGTVFLANCHASAK